MKSGIFARAIPLVIMGAALLTTHSVLAQTCPDGDGDGAVVCVDCEPSPETICGDCDDGNGDIAPGAPEYCNGIDDDCDGVIDNGFPVGPCDGPDRDLCAEGQYHCEPDGLAVVCDDTTSSNLESCNGLDDDCDGLVDTYASSCRVGFGVCERSGPASCEPGDLVPACHVLPGAGSAEVCDRVDNNCDGMPDEDLVESCSTPCGQGLTKCIDGEWSACTARPCCDCIVGPTGNYPAICDAVHDGCQSVCVQPGTYSMQGCASGITSLVSTAGKDLTKIVGGIDEAARVQGFTVEGYAQFFRCGHFLENHLIGGLLSYDDCNGPQVVAFNEIDGGMALGTRSLIWGNTIHGGIEVGFRRLQFISGNTISDAGIGVLGRGGEFVDENEFINCQTGILLGQASGAAVRNRIIGGAIGIQLTGGALGARDPHIVSNTILGPTEAGITFEGAGDFTLVGNLIDGSDSLSSTSGAGIRLSSLQAFFINLQSNTIVGGSRGLQATYETAAGAVVPVLNVVSNIIVGSGPTAFDVQDPGPLIFDHNDAHGQANPWAGVPFKAGMMGNISEDPRFVDSAAHDMRLRSDSPCVDAGVSYGIPLDLDGLPRVRDGNIDGSAVQDMGAFEVPDEVLGLGMAADGTDVHWDAQAHATAGYDVYYGRFSEIRPAHSLVTHQAGCHLMSTVLDISSVPIPPGEGLVYLVAPHGQVAGSLGFDSAGQQRPVTHPCP